MGKGHLYRACPPAQLQEALDRQRRLLHGQDLRSHWNLPKVSPSGSLTVIALAASYLPVLAALQCALASVPRCYHFQCTICGWPNSCAAG